MCACIVKPARLHFARAARALVGRCVSEAFCPNIQPRAHARLTGLTKYSSVSTVGLQLHLTRYLCTLLQASSSRVRVRVSHYADSIGRRVKIENATLRSYRRKTKLVT